MLPQKGFKEVALLGKLLLPPLPDELVVLPKFPLIDLLLHFSNLLGLQRLLNNKVGDDMQDKFVHEIVVNIGAVFQMDPQEPDCIWLGYLGQQPQQLNFSGYPQLFLDVVDYCAQHRLVPVGLQQGEVSLEQGLDLSHVLLVQELPYRQGQLYKLSICLQEKD